MQFVFVLMLFSLSRFAAGYAYAVTGNQGIFSRRCSSLLSKVDMFTIIEEGGSGSDSDINSVKSQPQSQSRRQGKKNSNFRQHVNPLSSVHQQSRIPSPLASPTFLSSLFVSPSLPFHLDVGCAKGKFTLDLARESEGEGEGESNSMKKMNILGVEIRKEVAEFARNRINTEGYTGGNVAFLQCNANVDLAPILSHIHALTHLQSVSINFPDPHFKEKHKKRRVHTPEFVRTLREGSKTGVTRVVLQSDVKEVLDDMRRAFQDDGGWGDEASDSNSYESGNFFNGIKTDREKSVEERGLPVWRCSFRAI